MRRTLRWSAWEGAAAGLEHLDLRADADGFVATGMVIGASDEGAFSLHYRLVMDAAWRLREADLATAAGGRVRLSSDGTGGWRSGDGRSLPGLDGCIDVDIEATPFTNTLPIRRLNLARGQDLAIRVAYVAVPSLHVHAAAQLYTALDPPRLYRFRSLDNDFTADLPVDQDGLVLDYPGLFRRLPS